MDVLLLLALAALPLGALVAVAGAVIALASGVRPLTIALSASVAVLLLVWVVSTYRSGVIADETGGGGDVFSDAAWLAAAVVAGATGAALGLRARRRRGTA